MSHTNSMRGKVARSRHHKSRRRHPGTDRASGDKRGDSRSMAVKVIGAVNFSLMTQPTLITRGHSRQRIRHGDKRTFGQRRSLARKRRNQAANKAELAA